MTRETSGKLLSLPTMAMGFYRHERETKCGASRSEAKEWGVTNPKESMDGWSIAWEEDVTRSRTDGSGLGLRRVVAIQRERRGILLRACGIQLRFRTREHFFIDRREIDCSAITTYGQYMDYIFLNNSVT
jgi:hypothetical protein